MPWPMSLRTTWIISPRFYDWMTAWMRSVKQNYEICMYEKVTCDATLKFGHNMDVSFLPGAIFTNNQNCCLSLKLLFSWNFAGASPSHHWFAWLNRKIHLLPAQDSVSAFSYSANTKSTAGNQPLIRDWVWCPTANLVCQGLLISSEEVKMC